MTCTVPADHTIKVLTEEAALPLAGEESVPPTPPYLAVFRVFPLGDFLRIEPFTGGIFLDGSVQVQGMAGTLLIPLGRSFSRRCWGAAARLSSRVIRWFRSGIRLMVLTQGSPWCPWFSIAIFRIHDITSASKGRKSLDEGKIWTRETDDAVITA